MKNKIKYVAIGIILGILVSLVSPINAAIEEFILYRAQYRVIINNKEYTDPDLPILNYKGYTYCPMRSMLKAAGLTINWDAENGVAEVDNPIKASPSNPIKNETNDIKQDPIPKVKLGETYDYNDIKITISKYEKTNNELKIFVSIENNTDEILSSIGSIKLELEDANETKRVNLIPYSTNFNISNAIMITEKNISGYFEYSNIDTSNINIVNIAYTLFLDGKKTFTPIAIWEIN